MAEIDYQKLPGKGYRYQGFIATSGRLCRLYRGPDHVLATDTFYWTQEYKRFYFRDIQAITCRGTKNGRITNIVLGLLAIPLVLLPVIIPNDPVALYFALALGTPVGVALLLNTLAGPTCKVWIKTAVHSEVLPSLKRRRSYRKVVAILEPLIRAAQPVPVAQPSAAPEPAPAQPPPADTPAPVEGATT